MCLTVGENPIEENLVVEGDHLVEEEPVAKEGVFLKERCIK